MSTIAESAPHSALTVDDAEPRHRRRPPDPAMKKSILDKLERLSERLAEIDGLLGGEQAARDMDSYRKLTRD